MDFLVSLGEEAVTTAVSKAAEKTIESAFSSSSPSRTTADVQSQSQIVYVKEEKKQIKFDAYGFKIGKFHESIKTADSIPGVGDFTYVGGWLGGEGPHSDGVITFLQVSIFLGFCFSNFFIS
jgi:hypothetical protein